MSEQDLLLESLRGIRDDIKDLRAGVRRVHDRIDALQQIVVAQQIAVGRLKVKAGVWGLAAGALPAIGAALWVLLK